MKSPDRKRLIALRRELKALKAQQRAVADEIATLRADRDRHDAIMALPEAEGRLRVAIALNQVGLSASQAKTILALVPTEPSEPEPRPSVLH